MTMTRTHRSWPRWLGLWLLVIGLPSLAAQPNPDDSLNIQRILITPEQLATRLQVERTPLVRMSREKVEELLRQFGRANELTRPRLIETRYRARLDGENLSGTGEWKLVHSSKTSAWFPLESSAEPFALALREARWQNNQPAIIDRINPTERTAPLQLFVEGNGEQSLMVDWSSRGYVEPGELRFELGLPAAPLAVMELDLPIDVLPTAGKPGVIITGPFPDNEPNRRTWQIAFGGQSRLPLLFRRPQGPNQPKPLILARQNARQDLAIGEVQVRHDIEMEVLHGAIRECTIECDPNLRITDVRMSAMEGWAIESANDGKSPQRIHIRLRDSIQGARLEIAGVSPIRGDGSQRWRSPQMLIVGAQDAGETLELHVPADVQLNEWNAGGFRLQRSRLNDDRSQSLTLVPALLPATATGPRPRPEANIRPLGPVFVIQQQNEVDLQTDQTILTVNARCEVQRGALTRLPLLMPMGYRLESFDVGPTSILPLTSTPNGNPPTIVIEPQRSVSSNEVFTWVARFRGPPVKAGTLNIPDLLPIGARQRTGNVRIRNQVGWELGPSVGLNRRWSRPLTSLEGIIAGSSILTEGSSSLTFRLDTVAFEGPLLIRPRADDDSIRVDAEVSMVNDQLVSIGQCQLPALNNVGNTLFIILPSNRARLIDLDVTNGVNRIVDVQPARMGTAMPWLSALGSVSPLDAVSRFAAQSSSEWGWWQVQLARPPREGMVLRFRIEQPLQQISGTNLASPIGGWVSASMGGPILSTAINLGMLANESVEGRTTMQPNTHRVPIFRIATPIGQTGTYRILLPSSGNVEIRSTGFRDLTPVGGSMELTPSRVLEMHEGPFRIDWINDPTPIALSTARIDDAELLTRVESGRLLCRYRMHLMHWPRRQIPVLLPADARLLALHRDGKAIDMPSWELVADSSMVRFQVPTTPQRSGQVIELLYTLPRPGWWFNARLDSPAPEWPFEPELIRRIWEMPADLVPLNESGLTPLPSEDRPKPLPTLPDSWLQLGREWLGSNAPTTDSPLYDPAAPWTPRFDTPIPFSEILRRALELGGTQRIAIIIDVDGLRTVGLSPASLVRPIPSGAVSLWEALGLTLAPCGNVALLTTPQRAAWFRANRNDDLWPTSVLDAVQIAQEVGRDPSGRFRTIADWLEFATPGDAEIMPPAPPGTRAWEQWGSPERTGPIVVNLFRLRLLGWAIAFGMGIGIGWFISARPRIGGVLLLIWVGLAATIFLIVPRAWFEVARPSLVIGLTMAVVVVFIRRPQTVNRSNQRSSARMPLPGSRVIVKIMLIALLVGLPAQALAPEPTIVYLLEGSPDVAYVPQSLLDKIDSLRRARAKIGNIVALSAQYDARIVEQSLRVDAHFRIRSFSDQPGTFVVPLTGIQLRDAILDGAPALPTRLNGEPERYAFDVKGSGSHQLLLKFSVPISGTETDREVRFGIPELVRSRLNFEAPGNLRQLQALNWRGAQRVIPTPNGQKLEADLGAARTVQLRWRSEGGSSAPPRIRVQSLAQWDLDTTLPRLRASLGYRIGDGAVESLRIELPPATEVARVELRVPDTTSGNIPIAPLREWRTIRKGNEPTILVAELQAPFSGELRLDVELVSQRPLRSTTELRFIQALDASEVEAQVAVQLRDLSLTTIEATNAIESSAEAFQRLWQLAQPNKPNPPVQRAFQVKANESAVVRLSLQNTVAPTYGRQILQWSIRPQQLELAADLLWDRADGNGIELVEWELPVGLDVVELTGASLRSWSRAGNRVQVWLRAPATKVRLFALVRGKANLSPAGEWDLPSVRQLGVSGVTNIRIVPPSGWTFTASQLIQLGEDDERSSAVEHAYRTDQPNYQGRFVFRSPQTEPQFRIMQAVSVRQGQVRFDTQMITNLRADRTHGFRVSLIGAPEGYRPQWNLPTGSLITEVAAPRKMRTWNIELPVQPNRTLVPPIQLVGEVPLDTLSRGILPEFRIDTGDVPPKVERWAVLVGPEIQASKLQQVVPSEQPPSGWTETISPGSTFWRLTTPESRLSFQVGPTRPVGLAPASVTFTDVSITRIEDRWLVRAALDCIIEGPIRLQTRWPRGAVREGLLVDGRELAVDEAWQVEAGPHTHQVLAVWSYAATERTTPPWELFQLIGPDDLPLTSPIWWTLIVPPGDRLQSSGELATPQPALARNLSQIEAGLRRLDWLQGVGANSEELHHELARIEWWMRIMDIRLMTPRRDGYNEAGTNPQPFIDRIVGLRAKVQSWRERLPDAVRYLTPERAGGWDRLPWANGFQEGKPLIWNVVPGTPSEMELVMENGNQWAERIGLLWFVLSGLSGVAILGLVGKRVLWPEQIGILAVVGLMVFGWSGIPVWGPIVLIAVIGRLWLSIRWLGRRIIGKNGVARTGI